MKLFSHIFIVMLLIVLAAFSGGMYVYGQELNTAVGTFNVADDSDNLSQQTVEDGQPALDIEVGEFNTPLINSSILDEEDEPLVSEITVITPEDEEAIVQQRETIKDRDNIASDLLDDSDGDGLTDFDEINVYGTDPNDANTGGGAYSDGEDILRGLNPLEEETVAIVYEDPRQERGELSTNYTVDEIEVIETEIDEDGTEVVTAIEIRGTAQPKAFVTVYIFSNPIVVTVQADGEGKWKYQLEKRLEDGEHIAFAAAVNNSGKILLKSEGKQFSKRAAAVGFSVTNIAESIEESAQTTDGMFNTTFLLVAGAVIILALLASVLLSGITGKKEEEITVVEGVSEDTPKENV